MAQCAAILEVAIRNRGRREAQINHVCQRRMQGGIDVVAGAVFHVPFDVPAERTHLIALDDTSGYARGEVEPRRFFVVDGADRIHPLRERYLLRRDRFLRRGKRGTAAGAAAPPA